MSYEEYKNMNVRIELLEILAEAEDDVRNVRVAPASETLGDLRNCPQNGRSEKYSPYVCSGGWRCCWSQSNINRHPVSQSSRYKWKSDRLCRWNRQEDQAAGDRENRYERFIQT